MAAPPARVEDFLAQAAAASAARDSQLAAATAERDSLRRKLAAVASERDTMRGQLKNYSSEELRALVAARDAQIEARDAQIAARDSALARASADSAALTAAAASDRGALRAERALTSSVLARDATLAAAIFERDDMRRKLARPSVRAALLGEALLDAIGIVSAVGFAPDVNQCRELCRLTWRVAQRGDTASMLERSLELQCGAKAARAAEREDFVLPLFVSVISETTQLIRATMLNNLPRVLQLVQLGAKIDLDNAAPGATALHWASFMGHEHVAKALLDGKYEGRGATVDVRGKNKSTPLMDACINGHEAVVRLLLSRGAKQELKNDGSWTALHYAVQHNQPSVIALLCAAPGAAKALSLTTSDGRTPLALAIHLQYATCEAALRAHGATA